MFTWWIWHHSLSCKVLWKSQIIQKSHIDSAYVVTPWIGMPSHNIDFLIQSLILWQRIYPPLVNRWPHMSLYLCSKFLILSFSCSHWYINKMFSSSLFFVYNDPSWLDLFKSIRNNVFVWLVGWHHLLLSLVMIHISVCGMPSFEDTWLLMEKMKGYSSPLTIVCASESLVAHRSPFQ